MRERGEVRMKERGRKESGKGGRRKEMEEME